MKFWLCYELCSWNLKKSKLRRRYFRRSSIVFGSDPKADVKIESGGFIAKLSFLNSELEDLSNGTCRAVGEACIFEIDNYYFSWRSVYLPLKILLPFVVLVILLSVSAFLNQRTCQIAEIKNLETEFNVAIQKAQLKRAASELKRIDLLTKANSCRLPGLISMQLAYDEALILELIKTERYLIAARHLIGIEDRDKIVNFEVLADRILAAARRMRWSSWSLERSQPAKAYEIAKEAREICQILDRCSELEIQKPQ